MNPGDFVDFHAHLLPGVDDGSKDAATSAAMLAEMGKQGVRKVAATPHFYPAQDALPRFLQRRQRAVEQLRPLYRPGEHPAVYLGAEVAYYPGLARAADLRPLCLAGTRVLLLEMPVARWPGETLEELLRLRDDHGLQLVIAHIERPLPYQRRSTLPRLLEEGVLFQLSADYALAPRTAKKAARLVQKGMVQALGTDCHNLTTRPPRLGAALQALKELCPRRALADIAEQGRLLLPEETIPALG